MEVNGGSRRGVVKGMPLLSRRFLLSAAAVLASLAAARRGIAQVGSGGTGIAPEPAIGTAELVVGTVTLQRPGEGASTLQTGGKVQQGDRIETADAAEVQLAFDDGGYLSLRPNSALKINRYVVAGDVTDLAALTLLRGSLRSVTGWIGKLDPARYRINADGVTVGVQGTDHELVLVRPQDAIADAEPGVHDRVNEGATVLRSAGRSLQVEQGGAGYAARGAPPVARPSVPAFFDRLRTAQEARVDSHARDVRQHIEGRLRKLGKLQASEGFAQYLERVRPGRGRQRALRPQPQPQRLRERQRGHRPRGN
jgi:hypothetical protein